MNHHYQVVPECYADTLLVEMLGIQRPNHTLNSNISYVLKRVRKSRPNQKVVGIIDSDRGKSEKSLLDGFQLVEEQHGLKKYVRGKHTILVVCPAFEGWIFKVAADENIEPANYGFDKKKFAQECKRHDVKRNERVKNFLGLLKQRKSPGFQQLKKWICEGAGIGHGKL